MVGKKCGKPDEHGKYQFFFGGGGLERMPAEGSIANN